MIGTMFLQYIRQIPAAVMEPPRTIITVAIPAQSCWKRLVNCIKQNCIVQISHPFSHSYIHGLKTNRNSSVNSILTQCSIHQFCVADQTQDEKYGAPWVFLVLLQSEKSSILAHSISFQQFCQNTLNFLKAMN